MHICRARFRDYREGRGLFGKDHQLVRTSRIVRGTRSRIAPASNGESMRRRHYRGERMTKKAGA
jgi:hypothetical protein